MCEKNNSDLMGELDCGCIDICTCPSHPPLFDSEQYDRQMIRKYAKIITEYGGDVYVGQVINKRLHLVEGRVYMKISYPVREDRLSGDRTVEGWHEGDTAALSMLLGVSGFAPYSYAVINKTDSKIIALLQSV